MAITRPPKRPAASAAVDVEALINRGGAPPVPVATMPRRSNGAAKRAAPSGATAVILRIPDKMLKLIDEEVAVRAVKTPRHTWLIEAIAEKLERYAK